MTNNAGIFRSGYDLNFKRICLRIFDDEPEKELIELFEYMRKTDKPLFLMLYEFYYAFEFIYPYTDGNTLIRELWMTVLIYWKTGVFCFLGVENLLNENKQEYVRLITGCREGNEQNGEFVLFMLSMFDRAFDGLLDFILEKPKSDSMVVSYCSVTRDACFSRKQYMGYFDSIATSTASRDLRVATEMGVLKKYGDGRNTYYQFDKKDSIDID